MAWIDKVRSGFAVLAALGRAVPAALLSAHHVLTYKSVAVISGHPRWDWEPSLVDFKEKLSMGKGFLRQ